MLQVTLEEYEVQVDRIIDRLALDPQFPLAAAETSVALAMQLDAIRNALDTVYETYGVQQRDDVQKAHAALDELRDLLQRKLPFEREVTNAIGSGFRQQRADLATRWWHGEEPATELRKLVAGLRERADFAGGVRQ
jgi:hypothetical protein